MKTKSILLTVLLLVACLAKAQWTPSMTIPNPIPNYDGSYDDFGTNHLFYPNDGEIRHANTDQTDASSAVKFYTMNTFPRKYLTSDNNISYVHYKQIPATSGSDSIQRIDLEWMGSNTGASLARLDTQNFAQLNYFTQWFGSTGRTGVKGGAAIACQSIYPNIDLVYTSNNSGLVMYFIVYPGGNYQTIRMNIAGSKANSIVSNDLKIEANWEYSILERPQMYQYSLVGSVISPVNVGTADWQSIGSNIYQFTSTSSFNSALPLIIQIKQAAALPPVHTTGLKWSTYFGAGNYDFFYKTHCDANDNLFVAGYTQSSNFPTASGVGGNLYDNQDGIIAKFNASGVHQWSTFVGGSTVDEIHDFDFNGNSIYCVGKTGSPDMPAAIKTGASPNNSTPGSAVWDGFIFQLANPSLNILQNAWLTYYGGNENDELNGVKFDSNGNMFVVGASMSTDLTPFGPPGSRQVGFNSAQLSQSSPPVSTDAIIAKFDAGTSAQSWFTFYGTDALGANAHNYSADYFYGLTISGNDVYACGKAGGTNLPNSINSKAVSGNFDGILAHFTTGGVMNAGDAKFTDGNVSNYSVKVMSGNVYVVGEANSVMTPINSNNYYYNATSAGNSDGCFSVHTSNLSTTIHNSFLGGDTDDAAYDIQMTPNNYIYITGGTNSTDFPTFNLSGPFNSTGNPLSGTWLNDNFVTCLTVGNPNLTWSTYLGSDYNESNWFPVGMSTGNFPQIATAAVTSLNGLYVLGSSNSYTNFPRDEWYGFPTYFQAANAAGQFVGTTDGTITRFDLSALGDVTGIQDFPNTQFVFGIYPNPTVDQIMITNKGLSNENLKYAVYDLSGKKMQEGNLKASDTKSVDVSTLPNGIYIINVSNGKMTYSNKFIKSGN